MITSTKSDLGQQEMSDDAKFFVELGACVAASVSVIALALAI